MRAECHASTFMGAVSGSRAAWRFRARYLLAVPLAAAAVLVAVWRRPTLELNEMQAVVAASVGLDYRPSLARLSGNFPYRDVKPQPRGDAGSESTFGASSLWALIGRLQQER